ncbi:UNVERIFIED_CONTAM: Chaperone protein dnaJ 49 [Sesamum calycinum]|uniref:Chaperone protein dnaJ 49 n=1 Tax=Sesamum calycinum TaxID=2727403 RepID=A0AAW2QKS4_9LAMI
MDGNKDEALRCFSIAKDAIAAGNKQRAIKFLGIAARLNKNLPLDNLFAACKNLDSYSFDASAGDVKKVSEVKGEMGLVNGDGVLKGERSYTEEHADLVWEIKSKKDYYSIIGLERSCSVEEIRKAYRKLSLKVHPDKNKAPGSEEAFKKISKAFKCLSDDESRRQYDEMGLIDEFEYNEQHSGSWSWRRTERDFS